MKKDKDPEDFLEGLFIPDEALDDIRKELESNGLQPYTEIVDAIGHTEFERAETLMRERVKDGSISIEDDVYAFFNGMICEALGTKAIGDDDMDRAEEYLRNARSFFLMARDRGLDIPPVRESIKQLSDFLGEDYDDEDDAPLFDTDAIDYLGFRRVFPQGKEFSATLRLRNEDFSIDDVREAFEDDWDEKLRSKKGRQGVWKLSADGVDFRLEYAKGIETLPEEAKRQFVVDSPGKFDALADPSVAKITITAEVGEETSYERSIAFTKVLGAILSTHEGVSLTIGKMIRDPGEALEAIMAEDQDEWLSYIVNVGFLVTGNPAMSSLEMMSDGMACFGFPEIHIKKIGPDDYGNAVVFTTSVLKYVFEFGQGIMPDGEYTLINGARFAVKTHKKNGEVLTEISAKH